MSLRCVIVEDQTMFLQMLHGLIQGMPELQVVATSRTEAEGMAAVERHQPDVLLLDLNLPDGNGIEVARRLVALKPACRTVILSGEASTFVCPSELQASVHAVIDKTQAFDELAAALKSLLPKARGGGATLGDGAIRRQLSPREYEIFLFIGRGLMSKEIGEKLGISPQTVQTHRKKIGTKLGTTGPGLVQLAIKHYHATLGARR